jgi:hypothetical protein
VVLHGGVAPGVPVAVHSPYPKQLLASLSSSSR